MPVAHRLGEEGDGLEIALGGFLTPSRISVAMSCVGLAERAQQLAVEYARNRVTFGKADGRSGRHRVHARRERRGHRGGPRSWSCTRPAGGRPARATPPALSSMAKLTAVDMLTRVTDKALQVHGGIGYWKSQPIERVYRDARAQRFEEGTNEIQKATVIHPASSWTGEPGPISSPHRSAEQPEAVQQVP